MGLQSNHFRPDAALEACLVNDSKNVKEGAVGDHVKKIQTALKILDNLTISPAELAAKRYGPSTAAAVLAFKKKRRIINPAYQTSADNIVGKMTMAALDEEMRRKSGGGGSTISPDLQIVNAADIKRLAALTKAEAELRRLKRAFEPGVPNEKDSVVKAMQRQLFVPLDSNFWNIVNQLLSFIQTNRLTRTHFLVDKASNEFAHVDSSNQPGKGITFCASFFNTNDNCRQEVITHEFFHFIVGLQHFYSTKSLGEAMKCPHHLARVVFDIAVGQQLAPCAGSGTICR
jgi:peptidoglycan hydrolase-like protein with peptidoglycan-binding domain